MIKLQGQVRVEASISPKNGERILGAAEIGSFAKEADL